MSEATRPAENKMGTRPIGRLLLSMSLPMILSMLMQAMYNIVDSMFVAQLSEEALTAVSLAFPFQNMMIGVATGTGVGVNALLSKSLGEKNFDLANRTAVNSLFLCSISYIVFALAGIFLGRAFFETQTADPLIVEDGVAYIQICCIFSFGMFFSIAFEKLLQSTGKTVFSMVMQLTGAILNIILDPIFIFGYFGVPAMGVAGAAIATVIGQIAGAALGVVFNRFCNHDIKLRLRGFRPDGQVIRRIYMVGVPSIIMTSIGSILNFGINQILISFTATAAAVYGVYFKLQSFVFMPTFGLNNGMVPIISYNYGARQPERILKTIRLSILFAVGIMLTGLAVFQFFTPQLLGFFNASQDMLDIGVPALRTISLSFIFAGICIVSLSVCQAFGRGFLSLLISTVRQLLVILPLVYIFSRIGGLSALWYAYPIAEIVAVVLCAFILRHLYRTEILPLKGPAAGTDTDTAISTSQ